MSTVTQTPSQLPISWPVLPDDFVLPDDPVEEDQPLLAAALRQPLTVLPNLIQDALVVTDYALYAAIQERIICKAPD